MSRESDKPFVCSFPGCLQRFANNDHLSIHKTKHELSLKLGGRNEVLLVDQTPTPTRFLRNCEETGLFQELEANPFDRDFKQAGKSIESDERSDNESHTRNSSSSSDVTSRSNITSSTSVPVAPPPSLVNPQKSVPMATVPAHVSNATAFTKQKLLETIHNKQYEENQIENNVVMTEALKAVIEQHGSDNVFQVPQQFPRRRGRKPDEEEPEVKRQKFLERNRAAASRCRARKKQWVDGLDKKSKELEILNTSLQQEVIMLRAEVQQLKSFILAHKDCPLLNQNKEDSITNISNNTTMGVTLLSQLQSFSGFSPLVGSPPSATLLTSPLFLSSLPTVHHSSLDVGKSVEISAEGPNNQTD